MAIQGASIIGVVSIQGANAARAQLLGVSSSADAARVSMSSLASLGVAGLAVGLAAVGIASVKMAADFQQGVNRWKTGAGDVTDNLQKMGQGVLQVSTQTGVLTNGMDGLNAAMYLIISSGQRGSQALDTLSVAAKGAQIEQAKVVDVSNALSTAMTDYGTKQFNATQFMNGFIAAVSTGKITLEAMSTAMSPILPVAQKMGVSFADISSAMSTMTDTGMGAARAATGLRFLMQSLEVPTAKASNAFKEWGVNTQDLANEMRVSLPGALQMIYDAAKKAGPEGSQPFNKAISDMIGGQRSLQAFLDLTGTHLSQFEANSKRVATAMNASKTAVQGWDTAQTNFNVQLDRAHAAFDAVLIQLGTQLLPLLTPIVSKFADWLGQLGQLRSINLGGFISTLQSISGFLSKIGSFVINSQEWRSAATDIGAAADQLGRVVQNLAAIGSGTIDLGGHKVNLLKSSVESLGALFDILGKGITSAFLIGNILMDTMQHKTLSVEEAVFQLNGTINTGKLSVKDATSLMALGFTHVKDTVTGADINLQQYVRTGGLASSTSVSMANALKLVGAQTGHILTAADAAKLLALGVKSVDDPAHRVSIDLALIATNGVLVKNGVVSMSDAFKILGITAKDHILNATDAQKLLALGVKDVNDKVRGTIDLQKELDKTKAELKLNDAQVIAGKLQTDQLRNKLSHLNDPLAKPPIDRTNILTGQQSADILHNKLLHLNDPVAKPPVDTSSIVYAGAKADEVRRKLLALNGESTWTATVTNVTNTIQNTIQNTIGSGPGNARAAGGLITEPVVGVGLRTGQRWSFGEGGPEMVVPMSGLSGARGSGGGGSAQPVNITINVAGRQVAQVLLPDLVSAIRTATGARI
jgi:TP901 family phage tail tape measure protein